MSPPPQRPATSYLSDLGSSSSNTTFVQADPSTFRTIVQRLTGAPDDASTPKLPLTPTNRPTNATAAVATSSSGASMGPKRPAFKLHERRQTAKKLEITLSNNINNNLSSFYYKQRGGNNNYPFMVSPVSTLEFLARVSPRSPREEICAREDEEEEKEQRAIAEKGFYLHKSPLSTPRGGGGGGGGAEPELLPLFPLTSPRNNDNCNN